MFGLGLDSIKWIAAGLAALVIVTVIGGFWLSYQHTLAENKNLAAANAAQAEQLDRAAQVNAEAVAALAEQKKLHEQDMAAITKSLKDTAAARDRLAKLQKDTLNAPATDDGPLAPLARAALGKLRDATAAPAPGPAPGGTGNGPGAPSGVPRRALSAAR